MSSPETMSFIKATYNRQSIRSLQASSTASDANTTAPAEKAILHVPSAARIFYAKLGEERFNAPSAGRPSFRDKVASYMDAYGTILVWDDMAGVKSLRDASPEACKDKIEAWPHQSSNMHQYYLWTALEALGLGENLQHYNPVIDDEVKRTWDVSEVWALRAQMIFGAPVEGVEVGEKVQTLPVKERLKVFGAESE